MFALQVLAYIVFRTGLFSTLFAGSFDSMLGKFYFVFLYFDFCIYVFFSILFAGYLDSMLGKCSHLYICNNHIHVSCFIWPQFEVDLRQFENLLQAWPLA